MRVLSFNISVSILLKYCQGMFLPPELFLYKERTVDHKSWFVFMRINTLLVPAILFHNIVNQPDPFKFGTGRYLVPG